MDLRLKTQVQIDAPMSQYHGQTGTIAKRPLLDHKGRPTSVQIDINGALVWFAISAISAINPVDQEQAA